MMLSNTFCLMLRLKWRGNIRYVLYYLADQEMELVAFVTIAALFAAITSLVIFGKYSTWILHVT